jgi:hypothetical protein
MSGEPDRGDTSGQPGSTRVHAPGTVLCKCDDETHINHDGVSRCSELEFKDGYCRECYRLIKGLKQATD